MKGKATVKGTQKMPVSATPSPANGNDPVGHAPAVPISIYRDLAKELDSTKKQLAAMTAQNSYLQQQNKSLRQEVIRVIQSAAALKDILQSPQPAVPPMSASTQMPIISQPPTMPRPASSADRVSEDLIAELDRSLAADLSASLNPQAKVISPKAPNGVIQGPYCELVPGTIEDAAPSVPSGPSVVPEPLFTEQQTVPPNAIALEDEQKSGVLGGVWLPLTLVVVIVTAFSAGFLIVLPFIEADRNN